MLNNTHPPETTILPVILTHIVPLQNIIKSQQSSDSATVWRSWLKKTRLVVFNPRLLSFACYPTSLIEKENYEAMFVFFSLYIQLRP